MGGRGGEEVTNYCVGGSAQTLAEGRWGLQEPVGLDQLLGSRKGLEKGGLSPEQREGPG